MLTQLRIGRLTFNTTILPLQQALGDKRLLVREPLRPRGEPVRWLIVDPYIDALLDGHTMFGQFPAASAEKLIGIFSAGQNVKVSRKITDARPDVEQIVNADEVWALCARTPVPGWRILGRFIASGQFIALRAWDKHKLAGNYPQAAAEIINDWELLFPSIPAFSGPDVGAYLGGVFRDVDEP